MLELFATSLWETIVMVGISGIDRRRWSACRSACYLRLTDQGGVLQNRPANRIVGGIVNAVRSTPFIILLVAIIPLTRLVDRLVDRHRGGRGAADASRPRPSSRGWSRPRCARSIAA